MGLRMKAVLTALTIITDEDIPDNSREEFKTIINSKNSTPQEMSITATNILELYIKEMQQPK